MTTNEEWRDVEVVPGYQVSSLGRMRSCSRTIPAVSRLGLAYERRIRGRLMTGWVNQHGYLQVTLSSRGARSHQSVHILVATAFHGQRPPGMEACHRDGNSLNNAASNLRWGTPGQNKMDTVRHGTHVHARKSVCPRQHALVAPNLAPWAARVGRRSCLACTRARSYLGGHPSADLKTEADLRYVEIMRGAR